jgi:S-DNA-T family DNA segregation ATPase FtsK/SpoIIIE
VDFSSTPTDTEEDQMAASAKSKGGETQGRKREIVGICLLGFGIFCVLSLISMQTGSNRMMGPGGAAAAAGLYSLAGFGAYLLVAVMLVIAVRCFRGRVLQRGVAEISGTFGVLASMAVLLHLPFADEPVVLRGPGGLLGQWLGEIMATFIGGVGAALAAATLLCISLLLLTDTRMSEALAVVTWGARQVGRLLGQAGGAVGRVVVAMFPEKDEREEAARLKARDADEDEELSDEDGDDEIIESPRALAPVDELEEDDSVAVRVGRAHALEEEELIDLPEERPARKPADDERRAVAALVAEVAAVECAAEAQVAREVAFESTLLVQAPVAAAPAAAAAADEDEDDETTNAVVLPPVHAKQAKQEPGPIIVEPPYKARQRREEEAAAAAAEKADAGDDGKGFIQLSGGAFALPSTEMLEYQPPQGNETDKAALYEMAERLEQAMTNYGVRGKVKEIHMGPVVTMFEFAPAPGTRTGKIAQLENDLAMALEAQAVRIVAPIPGKAVVGVEVPNKRRETVYLKEILEDECFTRAASKLQVGLGKDIKGAPVSVNLSKMPHLLVAGTTGSGKSVAVNSMITSVLYNASPEEVRFIMVDPKMLELSIYEGIPHLLLPVVTDPKKANLALRWAVEEMERRYELLAKSGVRDIASYNARLEAAGNKKAAADLEAAFAKKKLKVIVAGEDGVEREVEVEAEAEGEAVPSAELAEEESNRAAALQAAAEAPAAPPERKLPYIIIVIDEFADLMMVAPKDVETSVARIAQKARAAGLHLILATQRPSVDVITGLIKANFPSRIALQVASKIDSRTILDQPGAETLLGNGDMLFSDRGTKLRRIHGAFLSDEEVHRVVDFLKKQAKPVYDMDILKPREEDAEEGGAPVEEFHDALYDQAVAIVCETRQASVSFIQRRLQIGYNRSARMVEQMERDGIVGPANGIKPREVIAPGGEYLANAV